LPASEDIVVNEKSIFNSDEEEEPYPVQRGQKRKRVASGSFEVEEIPDKNSKFDPQQFLAQIENASQLEAKNRFSELKIVEYSLGWSIKD
jgi:hypothetical protein